jgi:hypothetical protein
LVEQLAFNQWVAGSSPARLTTIEKQGLGLTRLFRSASTDQLVENQWAADQNTIKLATILKDLRLANDVRRFWFCQF